MPKIQPLATSIARHLQKRLTPEKVRSALGYSASQPLRPKPPQGLQKHKKQIEVTMCSFTISYLGFGQDCMKKHSCSLSKLSIIRGSQLSMKSKVEPKPNLHQTKKLRMALLSKFLIKFSII